MSTTLWAEAEAEIGESAKNDGIILFWMLALRLDEVVVLHSISWPCRSFFDSTLHPMATPSLPTASRLVSTKAARSLIVQVILLGVFSTIRTLISLRDRCGWFSTHQALIASRETQTIWLRFGGFTVAATALVSLRKSTTTGQWTSFFAQCGMEVAHFPRTCVANEHFWSKLFYAPT